MEIQKRWESEGASVSAKLVETSGPNLETVVPYNENGDRPLWLQESERDKVLEWARTLPDPVKGALAYIGYIGTGAEPSVQFIPGADLSIFL